MVIETWMQYLRFFFFSVILFCLETEDIQHILNKRVAEEILEIINKID